MHRKRFGLLIRAMRHEIGKRYGEPCTQSDLARHINATRKIISNLERGEKIQLDRSLLLSLANAFRLTTRERAAFFAAANAILDTDLPRPQLDSLAMLARLQNMLQQTRLPAFIIDDYDNVVAINRLMLNLFPFIESLLLNTAEQPGKYNVLRFVFSQESSFSQAITENRERYLLQTVYFFRAISLTRRATRFYRDMLQNFETSPHMGLWREIYHRSLEQNEDFYLEHDVAGLEIPGIPPLRFYSPPQLTLHTPQGQGERI